MHTTEGVTYHLSPISALAGRDHQPVQAFAYVASFSRVLLQDGQPVMVRRPNEKAAEHTMTAEEAVDYMLQNAQDVIDIRTARSLVKEMRTLPLSERKRIQSVICQALGRAGISEDFTFPTGHLGYIGRADLDPAGKDDLLHLAEEIVEPLRPTDPSLRQQRKTDIAQAIRQRAHDELANHLARNAPIA
ncbi:MAG TPA: hypothetical protein VGS08_06135 [Candidatus Saccharimonadales bacterium]|nr:hypothetical protein [Candidatus Saccharimonadales bacterium]